MLTQHIFPGIHLKGRDQKKFKNFSNFAADNWELTLDNRLHTILEQQTKMQRMVGTMMTMMTIP